MFGVSIQDTRSKLACLVTLYYTLLYCFGMQEQLGLGEHTGLMLEWRILHLSSGEALES